MIVEGVTSDQVHAFTDDQGFPTLIIDGAVLPLLSVAFEHDIQTRSDTDILYDQLRSVEPSEELSTYSGNSCSVTIYSDRVTIESDILEDEEPLEMSLLQYRVILDAWTYYLRHSSG